MRKHKILTCKRPDHDNSKIICGYPLPCPWHTCSIDLTKKPTVLAEPDIISSLPQKKVYCWNCENYRPTKQDKGGWANCFLGGKCYMKNNLMFKRKCKEYKRKWFKFWV